MGKNRFYMYLEYEVFFDGMNDHEIAELIRAIFANEKGEEIGELSPGVAMAFRLIKQRLDNNREEYEKTCEARAEAAKRGGIAKAAKRQQKATKATKSKQMLPDNENDNDKDNDNEKEKEKEIDNKTPLTPLGGRDWNKHSNLDNVKFLLNSGQYQHDDVIRNYEPLWESIKSWMEYKDAKKPRSSNFYVNEKSMSLLLDKFVVNAHIHGVDAVVHVVDETMAQGYQGLLWDRIKNKSSPRTAEENREAFKNKWRDV